MTNAVKDAMKMVAHPPAGDLSALFKSVHTYALFLMEKWVKDDREEGKWEW